MKPNIPVMVVAVALAAPFAINATEQDANAERGDPARWSQPLKSPRERYENSAKEAAAALAEAMKECRGVVERRACVSAARDQHRRDLEAAKAARG